MKQQLTQQQIQKLAPLQLMLARLSQLSQTDLEHAVLEEIEKNPLLELNDDPGMDIFQGEQYPVWRGDDLSSRSGSSSGMDVMDITQVEELDFFDRLLKQAKESGLNDDEILIAEEIIGSLDESGFLSGTPIENIAYKLSVDTETAEHVLKQIQKLGPAGIAARDLQECMMLQLEATHEEPFVIEIIEKCFDAYMDGEIDEVYKELDLSDEDIEYAVEQIGKLNPKPAAGHGEFMKKSIIPDVILREKDGKFYVALNETGTPEVRLSETYLKMLDKSDLDKNTKRYLTSNKQAAQWFMQAIEQRKQSIIAIAQSIVHRQRDMLVGKREHPLPMIMKEVAEDTRLDISTVSRVVNGKYMQTPSQIYELRYFFSEKAGRNDGHEVSTRDLEQDLIKIIENEDKTKPLSDEALQVALTEKGYNIARRTVAKYREKTGIPGSRERRKT
ncbi:MAG: RNA polymerase factor sigma-54 [Candidatus Marinimicrobia bacterium]|nr:RNA polymerase factor sigma-54 [Candidatus Neomarinimicrobiota bacterium]